MLQAMLGRKIGMTQLFQDAGEMAVTAIEAGPCFVTQVKTEDNDGYNAVQLGFAEDKRLNSPQKGHLKGKGGNFKFLREFRVEDTGSVKTGQKIDVDMFQPGDLLDVTGVSKGKGFAGVVKRHHFAGGPKTHGQSDRHRAPGSIGSTTSPGRVWKGLRMAGHMGDRRVTVRHLKVVSVDLKRHLLVVEGAVPGGKSGLLLIRKAAGGKVTEQKAPEAKAVEPKAHEPKAKEPKAEQPKAQEAKAKEAKAQEPKAKEVKAQEPKAQEPKPKEQKAPEPKAEEPRADEAKAKEEK